MLTLELSLEDTDETIEDDKLDAESFESDELWEEARLAEDIDELDFITLDFTELEFVPGLEACDEVFPDDPPPHATNAPEHIIKISARMIISPVP